MCGLASSRLDVERQEVCLTAKVRYCGCADKSLCLGAETAKSYWYQ